MSQGAPLGNQNAKKGKAWADAVRRAIRAKYGVEWEEALTKLAGKLVDAADEKDLAALKEIGDRLDGKPAQTLAGDEESPVRMLIGWMAQSK